MTLAVDDLGGLDQFKATAPPHGYPPRIRTFYSPVDQVHPVELLAINSATRSLHIAMYGFDDDTVADAIVAKLTDPNIVVQLSLDKIEAGGKHEAALLKREGYPASSIAIGSSEHGRIMHLKLLVVDAMWRLSGSTNWSTAGESLQDNELTVIADPYIADEAIQRMTQIHQHMLATGAA